jgi:hypothetical protein
MIAAKDNPPKTDIGDAGQSIQTTKLLKPSHNQVPPAAKWLGTIGGIPFVLLALLSTILDVSLREWAHFALAAYGAVILSFLGGIHWGLAIATANPGQSNGSTFVRLSISVIPSLVGWCALLISGPLGLTLMASAFIGLLLFDWYSSQKAQVPAWYLKLRWPLTAAVVVSLTFAVFA